LLDRSGPLDSSGGRRETADSGRDGRGTSAAGIPPVVDTGCRAGSPLWRGCWRRGPRLFLKEASASRDDVAPTRVLQVPRRVRTLRGQPTIFHQPADGGRRADGEAVSDGE